MKPQAAIAGGQLGREAGQQAVGGPSARKVLAQGAREVAIAGLDALAPAAILALGVSPRCLPPLRGREDRRPDRERALLGMQVLHSGPCAHIFRLDRRSRDARNAGGVPRA